jgi:hypothetical protein
VLQANYTPARKGNQIFVAGHFVGTVEGGIFKKAIKFSKHALQKPPALALSVESMRQAEGVGARQIEITDKESGYIYSCTLEHFKRYSWQIQRGGFEPQRALALDRWTLTMSDHITPVTVTTSAQPFYTESTSTHEVTPIHKEPVQLGLWGK